MKSSKKTKYKKMVPRYVRNKHMKEMRTLLKNKGKCVNAKSLCLS